MNLTSISGLSAMIGPASVSNANDAARLRQEAKVKDARAALETLKQRKTSADEDQKAAAKQKIEQLKARIRMMRMTMPADPKAAARMASQLARELGAAVKAYAAAGGSTAGMGGASTPPTAAGASGEVESGEAAATADAAPSASETGGQEAVREETGVEADKAADGKPTAADPYRQVLAQQQAQAADQARKSEDKKADSEFMTEVKRLANELKSLLRQAAQAAKHKGDDLSPTDEREAEKAMAAMDQEIADAEQAVSGGGISLVV